MDPASRRKSAITKRAPCAQRQARAGGPISCDLDRVGAGAAHRTARRLTTPTMSSPDPGQPLRGTAKPQRGSRQCRLGRRAAAAAAARSARAATSTSAGVNSSRTTRVACQPCPGRYPDRTGPTSTTTAVGAGRSPAATSGRGRVAPPRSTARRPPHRGRTAPRPAVGRSAPPPERRSPSRAGRPAVRSARPRSPGRGFAPGGTAGRSPARRAGCCRASDPPTDRSARVRRGVGRCRAGGPVSAHCAVPPSGRVAARPSRCSPSSRRAYACPLGRAVCAAPGWRRRARRPSGAARRTVRSTATVVQPPGDRCRPAVERDGRCGRRAVRASGPPAARAVSIRRSGQRRSRNVAWGRAHPSAAPGQRSPAGSTSSWWAVSASTRASRPPRPVVGPVTSPSLRGSLRTSRTSDRRRSSSDQPSRAQHPHREQARLCPSSRPR